MIRIVMFDRITGKPTTVLGLEQINFDRLAMGKPVKVNLRHIDPNNVHPELPDIDVVIADASTEDWKQFLSDVINQTEETL